MKNSIIICFTLLLFQSSAKAQILKAEYDKMWKSATVVYNSATAEADKKKANAIITQMEAKYPKDASVMLTRGVYEYSFLNDDNKALTQFSKAITTKPGYVLAYIYRAKVLAKKGVFEKAIEDLNLALEKEPNNITAINERADNYFQVKNYEKALADYRSVISLQPGNAAAYGDVANTLKILGKNDEANTLFIESLKIKTSDTTTLHALYGKYLLGNNNFKDSYKEFKMAMNGDRSKLFADDYNSAGVAAYKLSYYNNALHYFKQAQKISPSNINYLDNAASANLDNKNYYNIVRDAILMLQLEPDNAKANRWMGIGLEKSGRSYYYSSFNLRSQELEAKGTTEIHIPDTILFLVPTNKAAYEARINSSAYKEKLKNYLPDYSNVPGADWPVAFTTDFSSESGYTSKVNKPENGKTNYENKKLRIENLVPDAVTATWNTTLVDKKFEDICLSATFTVVSTDSDATAGIRMVNDNGAYYYFLVNPVTKKCFIAEWFKGKYIVRHGTGDEGYEDIPGLGEIMNFKVISQNRELAFIINDKLIQTFDLAFFPDINTVHEVALHMEGKMTVEVSALSASYSPKRKEEIDLLTLNWREYTRPNVPVTPPSNNPSRRLLGTMLIYADYDTKFEVAEVFEIWGDEMNEKIVFGLMARTLNSYYTYSKYSWKRGQSSYEVTKGWDLRKYNSHGTYFTNGKQVH